MRRQWRLALVWAAIAVGLPAAPAAAQPTSFTFAAAGDLGGSSDTSASLNALAASGAELFFALGDLSYSSITPESSWCDFVKARVGTTFPFELISGNHEDNGPDGSIGNFAACLPDRLGGVVGSYAKEYYVDYPASLPLARLIMISPNLTFPGETTYSYNNGTAHQAWLSNAIDGARANGIPWVIVGMHKPCITAGIRSCETGPDLLNFLIGKKVDLILQGHDHNYQRGKQLAIRTGCSAISAGSFNANCVVDDGADGQYAKGSGSVPVIAGTFGQGLYDVSTGDSEAGYFAKLMGANRTPRKGFVKYTVSATQLSAEFLGSTPGSFTDMFTIAGVNGNSPPTASDASASTVQGSPVTLTLSGSDVETCDLSFLIESQPGNGTLSPLGAQPCTAGSPNTDTALVTYSPNTGFTGTDSFTYQVRDDALPSNTATASLTVSASGGATLEFPTIADATIKQSRPTSTFGSAQTLQVDKSPVVDFLLKFQVSGLAGRNVTGVKLLLNNSDGSDQGGEFRRVANNGWVESAVTWNTAPVSDSALLASLGAVSAGNAYEVNLPTSFITGDALHGLRVTSPSTDKASYWSKEKGGSLVPKLLVTVEGAPALPSISINDSSVAEGDAGMTPLPLMVTLSAPSSESVVVSFQTAHGGSATEGVDYVPTEGTLTFSAGETSKSVGVNVLGDTDDESNETFLVHLSGAVNGTIVDEEGVGTIIDDDGPPGPATLPFAPAADATIKQGSAGTNFGSAQTLEVDNSPVMHILLKFQVTGVAGKTVTSVKLRLSNLNSSSRGGDLRRVADSTWTESGVTWNNAPAADSAVLASLGAVSAGNTYEVTLPNSFITGDAAHSLRVTSTASDGADYWSKEKGGTLVPELIVTVS